MLVFIYFLIAIVCTLSAAGNWISNLDIFSHFQLWLPPTLLLLFFFSIPAKNRIISIWLFVLCIYHLTLVIPYLPIQSQPKQTSDPLLRILQCNFNANNSDYSNVIDAITELDPDIFVICEANHHLVDRMEHLHEKYPYQIGAGRWPDHNMLQSSGTTIWSKHQFINKQCIDLPKAYIQALNVDIIWNNMSIQLIAAHLPSPVTTLQTKRRNEGLNEIIGLINQQNETIIVGDLNTTVYSSSLRKFMNKSELQSIYLNNGYKTTWPSKLHPFGISIDHIFLTKNWSAVEVFTKETIGSDHRMLIADIQYSNE